MIQAEPVSILKVQVHMVTMAYEDDDVNKLYRAVKEILEENEKGATNNMIGNWNCVAGDRTYQNIVGPHGCRRRNK